VRRLWKRLLVVLSILGSAHFYIWWRFVHAPGLPAPWNVLATIAIIVLAPGLPLTILVVRRFTRAQARPVLWVAYTWFGCAVYLLLGAALTNLATLAGASAREAALAGVAAVAVTIAYGLVHARQGPVVRRATVPLPNLATPGYTIVQLTDVHIGWTLGADFARRVVDSVNALDPDLIVLTGDLVDGHVRELAPEVEPLRDLSARDGVFAVTGNHEYYWNADAWLAHLGSLGIRFLRNEHVVIRNAFTLAGTDDITARAMASGQPRHPAARRAARPPPPLARRRCGRGRRPPALRAHARRPAAAARLARTAVRAARRRARAVRHDLALRLRGHRLLGPAAAHRHLVRDRGDHARARVTASVPATISVAPPMVHTLGASPNTSICQMIAKQIWR
jgi:hypothetical protein